MGIKVALEHRTSYAFDRLVQVHPHEIRLRPAPHTRTPIEAYSLRIAPDDHFINWQQDAFGNFLARVVFPNRTRRLSITVGLIADLKSVNPFDFFIEEWAEHIGFAYPPALAADLEPYLKPVDESIPGSGPGELARAWVANFTMAPDTRIIDYLVTINQALCSDVGYAVRLEPGVQSPDTTLAVGIGSCRDTAWLLVSILRQKGLAARFVSGYLVQLTSDIAAIDGPSGPVADFTDLHAWAEVYIPGAGWVGLDPTSGLLAGEGHIPLSATPHPSTSAAISGATDVCESTLDFSNTVTRVHEDPRVTLPYTASAWEAVTALGAEIDVRLDSAGVGLTMGGEPTFVSVDDQVAEEWNTAADGPQKRVRASDLTARLKSLWAPTGLVQRSQGKWYPGEPLPRWQIGLYWRRDGQPLWSDPDLLADPWAEDREWSTPDGADRALLIALAGDLGLPESQVRAAYEDPLTRLAASVRRPAGDPVSTADDIAPQEDSEERRSELLAGLDEQVTRPAAHLLPLHRGEDGSGWESADWQLRRGRIVLTEGRSPAGLRLPLAAVSWKPAPHPTEADPLSATAELDTQRSGTAAVVPADGVPTTAMVAEIRDGLLYLFLPPLESLDDFVDLIARVEAAATCPLVIEGYGPPPDPRLEAMSVTPDPGVIEVNVTPTGSFAEQSRQLEVLYEEARKARLTTESFDTDGTHTGTGGGNHITLGGRTPATSPLLGRPELLVSGRSDWAHPPAVSYLL